MKAKFVYEAMGDILKGKSEEDIQREIENLSFEEYDYEMLKAIYPYNRFNKMTNNRRFRRKMRKIANQGFKDKKDPREVAKEIADEYEQNYENKIQESMGDILKPKSDEEVKKLLKKKLNIRRDKISIRITTPSSKYHIRETNILLKKYNLKNEKIGKPFVFAYKLTGDILDIFNFLTNYYVWMDNEAAVTFIHNTIE